MFYFYNMKMKFLIVCVFFITACTQSNEEPNAKLDDYIGVDLPSKEWNNEYGKPLIFLKDIFYPIRGGSYPKFVLYEI